MGGLLNTLLGFPVKLHTDTTDFTLNQKHHQEGSSISTMNRANKNTISDHKDTKKLIKSFTFIHLGDAFNWSIWRSLLEQLIKTTQTTKLDQTTHIKWLQMQPGAQKKQPETSDQITCCAGREANYRPRLTSWDTTPGARSLSKVKLLTWGPDVDAAAAQRSLLNIQICTMNHS